MNDQTNPGGAPRGAPPAGVDTYPEPTFFSPRGLRVYRYLLGRPMDGRRRTNSTFWRRASSGEASWWLRLAGWHRAGIRLIPVYVLLWLCLLAVAGIVRAVADSPPRWAALLTPGMVWWSHLTVIMLWVAVWMIREFGFPPVRLPGGRVVRVTGRRRWRKRVTTPAAVVVGALTGTAVQPGREDRIVSAPAGYRDPLGPPVVVSLPPTWAGGDQARKSLIAAVTARLGMADDVIAEWQLEGPAPRLLLQTPAVPPTQVRLADVLACVDQGLDSFVLGMSSNRAVSVSLEQDSPHIALSAGSGAGKTTLLRFLLAQAQHKGFAVVGLDWKMTSFAWLRDLTGVRVRQEIDDIHDEILRLGEELDFRRKNFGTFNPHPIMVAIEECNVTMPLLRQYWARIRAEMEPAERRTTPVKSPAIEILQTLIFAGRQFRIHMIYVAQRFSAAVVGGDARGSFGARILCRTDQHGVKMLAGDVEPRPKISNTPGVWTAIMGRTVVTVRAPMLDDAQARELAAGGTPAPEHVYSRAGAPRPASQLADSAATLGIQVGHVPPAALPQGRPLSDMVNETGLSLAALRRASTRDGGFPAAIGGTPTGGYLYDPEQIMRWVAARGRGQDGSGPVPQ